MPPRYAYWTILIDSKPTAFRATKQEELLPTLAQLRRTNKDVAMKWFARGKLWENPEQAQWAGRNVEARAENRGRDWRPGGTHEDPRARFDRKKRDKRGPATDRPWTGKPATGHAVNPRPPRDASRKRDFLPGPSGSPPAGDRPPNLPSKRPFGGRPPGRGFTKPFGLRPKGKPFGNRPHGRPDAKPFGPRSHDKPMYGAPPGAPSTAPPHKKPFTKRPFGDRSRGGAGGDGGRPWTPGAHPPKGAQRPWSAKPRGREGSDRRPFRPEGRPPKTSGGAMPDDAGTKKRNRKDDEK